MLVVLVTAGGPGGETKRPAIRRWRSNDMPTSNVEDTQRRPELLGQTVVIIGLTGATYDVDGGQQFVAA